MTMTAPGNGKQERARPNPQQMLKAELDKIRGAMAEVLPRHVTPERLIKVVLSCTARTPKLLECSTTSIVRCVMQAAELGLELGGLLGEAYLVPFKGEATCIVGYQGLLKLARQSGEVKSVVTRVVREGETIEIDQAENSIRHPYSFETADAPMRGVYALAILDSGERVLEVMSRDQVETIRKRSKAANVGPWVTDYDEMARKTVLRRLCKMLPKSAEKLSAALEADIVAEGSSVPELPEQKPRAAALTEGILARAAAIPTVQESTAIVADHSDEAPSDNPDEGP